MSGPVRIIAVIGPTASGKTEVGLELARQIGGEIVSVDSMQIYRWMDIGTAKPPREMRAEVPHHLIDILNPDQPYNAGQFAEDADRVIAALQAKGRPAILLGGTNLYLRALVHGIIPVPEISETVQLEVDEMLKTRGLPRCYAALQTLDPESAAKLHPNDVSRIVRALCVVKETGHSIQSFQRAHGFKEDRYPVCYVGTRWPREILYERINRRVPEMVEAGLIEEAESLLWRGYSSDLPALQSIGYKQAFDYLNRVTGLESMIADIQQKSRHYAKKQLTWYRNRSDIHWLEGNTVHERDLQRVQRFLDGC